MFINHTKKFVYLRVPKTASTSISYQLIKDTDPNDEVSYALLRYMDESERNWTYEREIEGVSPKFPHLNLQQLEYQQNKSYSDYAVYGCVRNVVDRFLDRCYHEEYFVNGIIDRDHQPEPNINKNTLAQKYLDILKQNPDLLKDDHKWKPQTFWLVNGGVEIQKIYTYENIDKMISDMIGSETTVKNNLRTEARDDKDFLDLDEKIASEIESLYSQDKELYEKHKS